MKICFFNLNAYSLFNSKSAAPIGGTEAQLYNLARALSKNSSFDVSFVTGDWGQAEVEKYENIEVNKSISLKKGFLNYLKAPFLIWSVLNKINADFYLASSAGMEVGLLALFCKIKNKKFIYRTAHDIDCNGEFARKKGFVGKFFEYGLKNASKIVVQSERNAKMIYDRYRIKTEIIHNFYEIIPRENIKKENYILWVSRCQKWKNPDILLNIAEKMPDKKFIMICPAQKNELNFYDQIFEKAKKMNNLIFIEKVPFNEIQEYYDKAFLFVGTSEYEGFPNTYVQACLGKTPIISYKVNPDNFITNNNLGYCCDGNKELMIEKINKIFSEKNVWEEKSKNALKYVKENHDMGIEGEKWERLILSMFKK